MRGRIRVLLVAGVALLATLGTAGADEGGGGEPTPPIPETGFLQQLPAASCEPTNHYEELAWPETVGAYDPATCRRMRFSYGPILVKPGQNDVLIGPVTIEKPGYAGYIVRFYPDLVDATGVAPGIEQVHLHHATWLNAYPQYGSGPFFAAGEEKTIATFPKGYGMRVEPTDSWLLLYMVHNETASPHVVWVTYDIDFIAEEDAVAQGIVPVKPVWLDVQRQRIHPDAPSTSGNPVFNVQKGFGGLDARSFPQLADSASWSDGVGSRVCSWPRQNCARHDAYDNVTPQQGVPIDIAGADWRVGEGFEGYLVGLGGHLHPGGIRDEVSIVRDGVERPIFVSDAVYWDRENPEVANTDPTHRTTWDFSMTVTGTPLGWKVKLQQGDILRLNAVYDSHYASWYENMGIVVGLVAAEQSPLDDTPAIDVFAPGVEIHPGVSAVANNPANYPPPNVGLCEPTATRLCIRGQVTHGHLAEAEAFGGCPPGGCPELQAPDGQVMSDIVMGGFTFGPADFALIDTAGIPLVRKAQPVRFWNVDTGADMWHTVTRCAYPCTGATGLDYPIADGGSATTPEEAMADVMDFDSSEIGYGVFFSPASGQIGGDKPLEEAIRDGLYWEFTPTEAGVYTFYCRIHHGMRGAFKVIE